MWTLLQWFTVSLYGSRTQLHPWRLAIPTAKPWKILASVRRAKNWLRRSQTQVRLLYQPLGNIKWHMFAFLHTSLGFRGGTTSWPLTAEVCRTTKPFTTLTVNSTDLVLTLPTKTGPSPLAHLKIICMGFPSISMAYFPYPSNVAV